MSSRCDASNGRASWVVVAHALVVLVVATATATAHPLNPALLELRERAGGDIEVRWRVPSALAVGTPMRPVFPAECRSLAEPEAAAGEAGRAASARWRIDCGGRSLVGARIGVEGLAERHTEALLRLELADGRKLRTVLRGADPWFVVPERAGAWMVLASHLGLGFHHILGGLDHLLFVLGLVLLVRGRRLLFATVTAFTVGHSVTLSLAVLGVVQVPTRPVEVLIAASILVVAVELTRVVAGRPASGRRTWSLAFLFGLLHGLGFAGALSQAGLPAGEIPLALASFNFGIELGQLLFVAVVLLLRRAIGLLPTRWRERGALLPAYGIGALATFWAIERMAGY